MNKIIKTIDNLENIFIGQQKNSLERLKEINRIEEERRNRIRHPTNINFYMGYEKMCGSNQNRMVECMKKDNKGFYIDRICKDKVIESLERPIEPKYIEKYNKYNNN